MKISEAIKLIENKTGKKVLLEDSYYKKDEFITDISKLKKFDKYINLSFSSIDGSSSKIDFNNLIKKIKKISTENPETIFILSKISTDNISSTDKINFDKESTSNIQPLNIKKDKLISEKEKNEAENEKLLAQFKDNKSEILKKLNLSSADLKNKESFDIFQKEFNKNKSFSLNYKKIKKLKNREFEIDAELIKLNKEIREKFNSSKRDLIQNEKDSLDAIKDKLNNIKPNIGESYDLKKVYNILSKASDKELDCLDNFHIGFLNKNTESFSNWIKKHGGKLD
jgi:hypothetical protein